MIRLLKGSKVGNCMKCDVVLDLSAAYVGDWSDDGREVIPEYS